MAAETLEVAQVRFAIPRGWQKELRQDDDGVSVFLQSPGVTFGILGVYDDSYDPGELVDHAVESLREEHPGLEIEERGDPLTDAVAIEILFMSLDTVSYCWMRGWRLAGQSILVIVQSIEPESEEGESVFDAICRSVVAAA